MLPISCISGFIVIFLVESQGFQISMYLSNWDILHRRISDRKMLRNDYYILKAQDQFLKARWCHGERLLHRCWNRRVWSAFHGWWSISGKYEAMLKVASQLCGLITVSLRNLKIPPGDLQKRFPGGDTEEWCTMLRSDSKKITMTARLPMLKERFRSLRSGRRTPYGKYGREAEKNQSCNDRRRKQQTNLLSRAISSNN